VGGSHLLICAGDLPLRAVREQIASAVQLILHQQRLRDGRRRVTSLIEVTRYDGEEIETQELFCWEPSGTYAEVQVQGELCSIGIRLVFAARLEEHALSALCIGG